MEIYNLLPKDLKGEIDDYFFQDWKRNIAKVNSSWFAYVAKFDYYDGYEGDIYLKRFRVDYITGPSDFIWGWTSKRYNPRLDRNKKRYPAHIEALLLL